MLLMYTCMMCFKKYYRNRQYYVRFIQLIVKNGECKDSNVMKLPLWKAHDDVEW